MQCDVEAEVTGSGLQLLQAVLLPLAPASKNPPPKLAYDQKGAA